MGMELGLGLPAGSEKAMQTGAQAYPGPQGLDQGRFGSQLAGGGPVVAP